jgi:hypothetical protein
MSVRGASNGPEVAGRWPALPPSEPQTKSPGQGRGFLMYLVPEIGIKPTTYALRITEKEQLIRMKCVAIHVLTDTPVIGNDKECPDGSHEHIIGNRTGTRHLAPGHI